MTSPRPNQGANQRQKSPRCSRATVFSITRHFDGGHGCDLERTSSKRLGGPNEFKAARSTDLFDWRPIASRKVGDKAVTHWLAIGSLRAENDDADTRNERRKRDASTRLRSVHPDSFSPNETRSKSIKANENQSNSTRPSQRPRRPDTTRKKTRSKPME